jgi:HSP20 family protein
MRNRNEREQQERGESGVTRWNPNFADGGRDPFERLFRWAGMLDDFDTARSASLAPRIDVEEDDDSYEITVELPGMKQEDIQVELNSNMLTISGEKRASFDDRGEKKRRSRWSERSYGRFTRSFTLPHDADPDRLEARFTDGVLTISIPKSEEAKPRSIQIGS